MASHANPLDHLITLALSSQTAATQRRKQAAWERLHAEASKQVMLVPYAVPPRPAAPPEDGMTRLAGYVKRGLTLLLTEDALYQRAAYNRHHVHRLDGLGTDYVLKLYPNSFMRYHAC